jgi:hypothetical protein
VGRVGAGEVKKTRSGGKNAGTLRRDGARRRAVVATAEAVTWSQRQRGQREDRRRQREARK